MPSVFKFVSLIECKKGIIPILPWVNGAILLPFTITALTDESVIGTLFFMELYIS